ncbi:MAG: hypothetical protein QM755_13300 [Luteolibacter sp.]
MSDETLGWFHCGRCGRMFQSVIGGGSRSCPHCGKEPSIFGEALVKLHQVASLPERRPAQNGEKPERKRAPYARGRNLMIAKILVGWTVAMVLIVGIVRHFSGTDDERQSNSQSMVARPGAYAEEDSVFLEKAIPTCGNILVRFLAAGTPEQRNQFVRNPIATVGKMARFYTMNPIVMVDVTSLTLKRQEVIRLVSGERLVGTVWLTADGKTFDAVFFFEEGEWRLDWDQFVRFSDYPWPLYASGAGGDDGEFRILVRQRASSAATETGPLSLTFYGPRFGFPGEPGPGSPEVEVARASEAGQLLLAAFREAKKGAKPLDGKLAAEEPEGLVRMRLKVHRWKDEHDNFHFEVRKVTACHWVSTDEVGVAREASPIQ